MHMKRQANQEPFGHLLIAFDSQTDAKPKFCTICSGSAPSVLFVASSNTAWAMSQKEPFRYSFLVKLKPIARISFFLDCPEEYIKFSWHCFFDIVYGQKERTGSASRKKVERHRKLIEHLCCRNAGFKRKRQFCRLSTDWNCLLWCNFQSPIILGGAMVSDNTTKKNSYLSHSMSIHHPSPSTKLQLQNTVPKDQTFKKAPCMIRARKPLRALLRIFGRQQNVHKGT